MKKHFQTYGFMALIVLFLINCSGSDFRKTDSGLRYKIIKAGENKDKKAKVGDFIDFHLVIKNSKDSVLSSTYTAPTGAFKNHPCQKPAFKGDISEVLTVLAEGDSAMVLVSSDTIANQQKRQIKEQMDKMKSQLEQQKKQKGTDEKMMQQMEKNVQDQIAIMENQMKKPLPDYIAAGSDIKYYFKILKIRTQKDIEKEQAEANKKEEERAAKQKIEDAKLIAQYIKEKKLEAKSTSSGLHYIITQEGKGEKAAAGDSVKVNYTGMLLNGKVFDSSIEEVAKKNKIMVEGRPYGPFEFQLGQKQVIIGWDEGIALLSPGSKATLIVPSHLAYGNMQAGNDIKPNSILVFEVELVGAKKTKQVIK